MNKKVVIIIVAAEFLILLSVILIKVFAHGSFGNASLVIGTENASANEVQSFVTEPETIPKEYVIEDVSVLSQVELKAGCETYACTMLLQTLGFDIDEFTFADEYLEIKDVYYGEDGNRYGPDMNSAHAGDVYTGWGVYAPAMAKFMNRYLDTQKTDLRAYPLEGVALKTLCEDYIVNDIPVMVWATTYMDEPYVKDTWTVDYVDENAKFEIGDSFSWMMNEHCLVLIGYDEENYYFADSCAGDISVFEKDLCTERYEQLGTQAIVVK